MLRSLRVRIPWGKTDLSRACIAYVENSLSADCSDARSEVVFLQTRYSLDCDLLLSAKSEE